MRHYDTGGGLARIQFDANGDPDFCDIVSADGAFERRNDVLDDILNDWPSVEISPGEFEQLARRKDVDKATRR